MYDSPVCITYDSVSRAAALLEKIRVYHTYSIIYSISYNIVDVYQEQHYWKCIVHIIVYQEQQQYWRRLEVYRIIVYHISYIIYHIRYHIVSYIAAALLEKIIHIVSYI